MTILDSPLVPLFEGITVPLVPEHLNKRMFLRLEILVERKSKRDGSRMQDVEVFTTKGDASEALADAVRHLAGLNWGKFDIRPIRFVQWYRA